jgi:hypothetical protein
MGGSDKSDGNRFDLAHPFAAELLGYGLSPALETAENVFEKYEKSIPKGGLLPGNLSGLGGLGKVGGPLFELAARSQDGLSKDDVVAVTGGVVAGELVGAFGGSIIAYGVAAGAIAAGPAVIAGIFVAGASVAVAAAVSYTIDNWDLLTDFDVETARLGYKSEFRSSDLRDTVAHQAMEHPSIVAKGSDGISTHFAHQDRESGAQVVTKVVTDPITGQKRAVYSTVMASNEVHPELNGNTYPPGHVRAGYELNALDRISEERNVWKNTPSPLTAGPQGNGTGPSDLNDPRGPWQIPGAAGDRTGSDGRSSGSTGTGRADRDQQDSAMDRGTGGTGSPTVGGGNPTGGTGTPRGTGGGGADAGQAANPAPRRDGAGRTPDDPRFTGPRPILLDLDGDGVQITEFGNSTQFTPGTDGLQHRSSWAAAGNGVLFFDPDGRNAITEARQYVFTEWNPTASGDLEALRSVWDTNGDGKLTAADTEFAKFKVLVTNADGSTTVMTLAALGITAINLTANAVNVGMPEMQLAA